MTLPFFSVVIPVYNRASELAAAIESVRTQTFQDFEIVVVDDGSTDNPRRIVEAIDDDRIRFFRRENGGGGAARNTGIHLAEGDFVAFLDSDDLFLPHHLASMHALLKGEKNLVGYARIHVVRGGGRTFLKPPRGIEPEENMATYLLADRGFTATSTMVVPREAAIRIRFPECLRVAEDTDFAIRLALAGYKFKMLEAPAVIWNDRTDIGRLSASVGGQELGAWLETMRRQIPPRAWHGARGWAYAKLVVRQHPLAALCLYFNAMLRGCYRPRLAATVFLQIFLGKSVYRKLADFGIARFRLGLRARPGEAVIV